MQDERHQDQPFFSLHEKNNLWRHQWFDLQTLKMKKKQAKKEAKKERKKSEEKLRTIRKFQQLIQNTRFIISDTINSKELLDLLCITWNFVPFFCFCIWSFSFLTSFAFSFPSLHSGIRDPGGAKNKEGTGLHFSSHKSVLSDHLSLFSSFFFFSSFSLVCSLFLDRLSFLQRYRFV